MPPPIFEDNPDLYDASQSSIPALNEDRSSSDEDEEPVEKKFRGSSRKYRAMRLFESKTEFDDWWNGTEDQPGEKLKWRVLDRHENKSVDTDYYRCQYSKRMNYDCKKVIRVEFSAEDESVLVSETDNDHNDAPKEAETLSADTKNKILELLESGLQPLRILNNLRAKKVDPLPTLLQIQNVCKRSRKDSSGRTFTLEELRKHCEENYEHPLDADETFVVRYRIESATRFCVVWSTKKLLEKHKHEKLIQLDSTYKTNYFGFPVQMAGFTDARSRFHPTLLCVAHSEDTWTYSELLKALKGNGVRPDVILGDGAKEITAACRDVFPAARRAMCWAHVIRQVDKRLNVFKKDLRAMVRDDLLLLQYARTDDEFITVAQLVFDSWPAETADFVDYLRNVWIDSSEKFWYEGLEAQNRVIKESHTLRRLLPFPQFLKVVYDICKGWSVSGEEVSIKPDPKPYQYKDAFSMSKSGRLWRKLEGDDIYVFASSESKIKSQEELAASYDKFMNGELESFGDFKDTRFKLISARTEGSKKKPCKHSIMISCLPAVNIDAYPPDATSEQLMQKKKTGRPSAKKAGRPRLAQTQNRHAVAN
ncbi:hypothetical protein AAVH_07053 [Aphelenchoides avenae]|nr:hypothetical protein AAVH_07051 [Aphelenchus avenae]KAH7725262.1 hypothetical protein AAVH_07053 [Aphelenchus avenae]